MQVTFNERLIAYLALISGLSISAVAVYYSVAGLTAIFAAAAIPIIIMGAVLEISKLIATVWLKQNWNIAPWSVRSYLLTAIVVLMLITSMGIFGFLSKAHSDQSLVSGDVLAKLSIYDEKIKTAKENIEANRRQLKQMDEAVDQVMARSTTEEGATKANNIRRTQQKDRVALAKEIEANQKLIASLNDEAAPIRAEVRKVEAEVGPLKYIAAFVYGDTNETILEKAVTWVIILIVVVFDPLAVILLLASQISFQNFREREQAQKIDWQSRTDELLDIFDEKPDPWVADVGEKPTAEELRPEEPAPHHPDTHPYLRQGFKYPEGWEHVGPMVAKPEPKEDEEWERWVDNGEIPKVELSEDEKLSIQLKDDVKKYGYSSEGNIVKVAGKDYTRDEFDRLMNAGYVQNEEQTESSLWKSINREEYIEAIRRKQEPKE